MNSTNKLGRWGIPCRDLEMELSICFGVEKVWYVM